MVIRTEGGFHTVQTQQERLLCTLAKRLRRGTRTGTNPLAVGDVVGARALDGTQGIIEFIAPRRNELARTAPGRDALKHVLAANVDSLVIVCSIHNPEMNLAGLDRFLIIAEQAGIRPAIVVNKIDLDDARERDIPVSMYRTVGYEVIETSGRGGLGVDHLRILLAGHLSAVVGSSGVGKSSLLNLVQTGLRLREGDVSERTGRGKHTTTVAALHELDSGGYVADTPGLRGIEPFDLDLEMLPTYFPEFRSYLGQCRFAMCSHIHEPKCAVRSAVQDGDIAQLRYDSYAKLYAEAVDSARPDWDK